MSECLMRKKSMAFERELKLSKERYRIVADFTYDWEFWMSNDKLMLYVSPSCERITGYKPEEFIKDDGLFEKIIYNEDKERVIAYIKKYFKSERIINIDFRLLRRDGHIRWVGHISQPVFGDDGRPLGRRASNRDITVRMKMEEELRKSEIRYRTVADFTYDWEFWISPSGEMLYVSPSCERITGYKPRQFIKDSRLFEKIIHPEDRGMFIDIFDRMSKHEGVISADFRILRKGGGVRWIGHVSQPVYGDDGRPLGRRASNRDITRNKKIESDLKNSREELNEKNIELEKKNIALKELLNQIEIERKQMKKNISINIDKLLIPTIGKLKQALKYGGESEKKYLQILENSLTEIYSSFGSKISNVSLKLTLKEIQVCDMIKNGFSNKEISDMLNLSVKTIETHRKKIRQKLNLVKSDVNLANFLQNYKNTL